ncbi:MAG: quinone-dependent dihydroorotate dehydrogenase [Caulobacteraceae bacterium]
MSLIHDAATLALRQLEPETAHNLSLDALAYGLGPRDFELGDPALSAHLAGMNLPNCVGLAAGYDKDARVPGAMLAAGFGFVECGTVTPLPQDGNPRPRLFRLPKDKAVINRFGFNSAGLETFAANLAVKRRRGLVGANLGANKESVDRSADYVAGLKRLWGLCDYFTVNISSPNTAGLRDLQAQSALEDLTGRLDEARKALNVGRDYPIFLKVAPDLTDREVRDIVHCAHVSRINGLIVSNTTISRPDSLASAAKAETGGLSGKPLMTLSTQMLKRFHENNESANLALVGAGGIGSGADAYAKIRAGACAVQVYTALVYQGPGLVRRIKIDLAKRLRADGFTSVAEARGAA